MTPSDYTEQQIHRYRQMSGEQRLLIALNLHEMSCEIARDGIRSALKVDFFRLAGDAYELHRFVRRRAVTILGQPAFLASPEDVILHKLRWYRISPSIARFQMPWAS